MTTTLCPKYRRQIEIMRQIAGYFIVVCDRALDGDAHALIACGRAIGSSGQYFNKGLDEIAEDMRKLAEPEFF